MCLCSLFQQSADISGWASADGSILLKSPDDAVNNISMKYSEFSSGCRQDKWFLYSPAQHSYISSMMPHFMYILWMKGIFQFLQQLLILLHTVTSTPLFCLANQGVWRCGGDQQPTKPVLIFNKEDDFIVVTWFLLLPTSPRLSWGKFYNVHFLCFQQRKLCQYWAIKLANKMQEDTEHMREYTCACTQTYANTVSAGVQHNG